VTSLLVLGVRESAQVNNVIVAIKVTVLIAFIIIGVTYLNPDNWSPFVPANEGGFRYGWQGHPARRVDHLLRVRRVRSGVDRRPENRTTRRKTFRSASSARSGSAR
jgi:hypothetical protein